MSLFRKKTHQQIIYFPKTGNIMVEDKLKNGTRMLIMSYPEKR